MNGIVPTEPGKGSTVSDLLYACQNALAGAHNLENLYAAEKDPAVAAASKKALGRMQSFWRDHRDARTAIALTGEALTVDDLNAIAQAEPAR